MKHLFTRAAWKKMDDVERILMSATLALLAIFPVLLLPKLWGWLLSRELPDLVSLREMLLVALYRAHKTPDGITEALAAMTLGTMMFSQLLQALLRATIRWRIRTRKDATRLLKKETPLAWAAWFMLAVPSIVYCSIFMLPLADKSWELNNPAVTNTAIVVGAVCTLIVMFMSVALAVAFTRGFEPEGPIKIFTCMKAPWAMLCVLTSGFDMTVVALAVSMVVLDVMLAPLDGAPVLDAATGAGSPVRMGK